MADKDLIVAGIGASAGGIQAMEQLFRSISAEPGLAFVVVTHQAHHHSSALVEILGRAAPIPVRPILDGAEPEANNVYVLPPDKVVEFEEGRFKLQPWPAQGNTRPIDVFFASLAKDKGELAVGILLSGGGSDGTLGLTSIKEQGGLTLAQGSNGGPLHSGMAESAISTGVVDLVLPVNAIAERLNRYVQNLDSKRDVITRPPEDAYSAIHRILRNQIGHDFSGYKQKTFGRRVFRRMQIVETPSLEAYVEHLQRSPEEVKALFRDLLIGVTSFFRDPEAFEALGQSVIGKILEGKGSNDVIRVWVPGCSTGEEVYSIAILFREQMDNLPSPPKIQLFATDIDEDALGVARAGRYPVALLENVSQQRLKRFFTSDEINYSISKDIRDLCIFSPHSVLKDPPFSRIDLISCRNLLIYLATDFQSKVIPIFHFALKPQGYLFLGSAENVGSHSHLFASVDRKFRIFQRREHAVGPLHLPSFEPTGERTSAQLNEHRHQHGSATANLRKVIESRVLDRHSPAYVVINQDGDVIFYSGRTGKYLEAAPGIPNRQLVAMTRGGLRMDLRAALREAVETRKTAVRHNLQVEIEDRVQLVNLTVEPLGSHASDPLFLVLFADVGQLVSHDREVGDQHSEPLEHELTDTRERLQATVEEYETAMEELKSSNEELQSMNEELQSTNEELETSKEELQSLNEELHTVNAELNIKVEETDRANTDLKNLFDSTQIATIFLDSNLIIRGFTPAVVGIFNLISSDRGRPLTDIVSDLQPDGDLRRDILTVIEHAEPIERRVRRLDGSAHYLMRILPYRGRNNVIDGALVTFVDVTGLVEAEAQQRLLIEELNHRVRNMLSVIGAIASQTVTSTSKPEEFREVFLGRLQSMGAAYGLLSQRNWGSVALASILEMELAAYRTSSDKFQLEGPQVYFEPPQALAFGLVVHELATNAAKYGALKGDGGRLAIKWSIKGGGLTIDWKESGGPEVKRSRRQGFGTELIRTQVESALNGEVDFTFAARGLQVRIKMSGKFAPEANTLKRQRNQEADQKKT